MEWWIWVAIGFVLLAAEMLTPGAFFAAFFGLGAIATGLLAAIGWAQPVWLQGVCFPALSIAALAAFRPFVLKRLETGPDHGTVDELVGASARARGEIRAGGSGKVELRGSTWTARNAGGTSIGESQACRVVRVEGLTLWVRAE